MSGVLGFAVSTSKGRVKQQNEDRANVIFNVTDKEDKSNCFSYFSVFDGHGGSGCSNYLRDHLHEMVLNSKHFPHRIKDALSEAMLRADKDCLQKILAKEMEPRSGSTALVAIVSSSRGVTQRKNSSPRTWETAARCSSRTAALECCD